MTKRNSIQYFDSEGRDHLLDVVKNIKAFLRNADDQRRPRKLIFLSRQGEGPLLAYNHLESDSIKIIAVTFPRFFAGKHPDGTRFVPEIPEKVRKFFTGVGIDVVTTRLPFDDICGAEAHNREMALIKDTLTIFGASVPLAIQAVLQATDAGVVDPGELVIAATGDTALLVTASTTNLFLKRDQRGLSVNEVICKPRIYNQSRKPIAPTSSAKELPGTEMHTLTIEASEEEK